MNKKYLAILSIFLITGMMLTMVNATASDSQNNNQKELKVGFHTEFPPFGYKDDNGEYTGFDIELAQEVCKRNNWTLSLQPIINWNTKDIELNAGEFDCIWSEMTINGREEDYTWSKPYFNNKQVFVVRSDSNINTIDDLKGKNLEIQEGTSGMASLNSDNKTIRDNFATITEVKDYNTAFMDLKAGACDVIVGDVGLAKYQIKEKYNDDLKILDEALSDEEYGIAFKKGNEELRNQIQSTLDEMYEDGTVEKIAQKYADYGIVDGSIQK